MSVCSERIVIVAALVSSCFTSQLIAGDPKTPKALDPLALRELLTPRKLVAPTRPPDLLLRRKTASGAGSSLEAAKRDSVRLSRSADPRAARKAALAAPLKKRRAPSISGSQALRKSRLFGGASLAPSGGGAGVPVGPCAECLGPDDLACGGEVAGDLAEGDCTLEDGSFVDAVRFVVEETSDVTLELTSAEFDTFLFLADGTCQVIGSNDDCAPGTFDLSCITATLQPGTYYLLVSSFSGGETGAYTVSATCETSLCQRCDVADIECGATAAGALAEGDCASGDGAFVDLHRFTLAEGGRVNVELASTAFDTFVAVLDAACSVVAANDDCEPGNFELSCITADLDAGDYFVQVTSFSAGEVGDYDLSLSCTSFNACTDCALGDLACDSSTDIEFPQSGEDCTREGGESLDLYSLVLEEEARLDISLNSAAIDTFLVLFDADCNVIAENDDCAPGNLNSCLESIDLPAGTYFIGLSSFDAAETGTITVDIACPEVAAICSDCDVGGIGCNDSVEGELAEGDCTLEDGTFADFYSFEVTEPSDIEIELTSDAFDTFLVLLDGNCAAFATNDDCEPGSIDRSCLSLRQVEPGTYSIAVNSFSAGESGAYTLSVECTPFDICGSCVAGSIECDGTTSGVLEEGDCLLGDGTFVDGYEFSIDRGQRVTIEMTSEVIDTYLILADGTCTGVAENDDCTDGSTNSCLVLDLPAGDYLIIANSFSPESGAYDLSVTCQDIPLCPECRVGEVVCNEPLDATLPTSECQLGDGTNIDIYEFELPEESKVDILLESANFDTFVFIFDSSCIAFDANDDCEAGDTSRSCLSLGLPAGTYFIGVNSFSEGETGDYTLTVSAENCGSDVCEDCVIGSVACGEAVSDELGQSECRTSSDAAVDAYSFTLDEESEVTISASSSEFDTLLTLADGACETIAENDDCNVDTVDSCITTTLGPGTYYVSVSSIFSDASGTYDLSVSCGGGLRLPGDCSRDGKLDISDGICILGFLFLGDPETLPCGDGSLKDSANLELLDVNGVGGLDLADAVAIFRFLFDTGAPPVQGEACIPIQGCEENACVEE